MKAHQESHKIKTKQFGCENCGKFYKGNPYRLRHAKKCVLKRPKGSVLPNRNEISGI